MNNKKIYEPISSVSSNDLILGLAIILKNKNIKKNKKAIAILKAYLIRALCREGLK